MVWYCNIYYIVILAWGLHYFFASVFSAAKGEPVPWSTCGNAWNSERCIDTDVNFNLTEGLAPADSVKEYWE